MKKLIISLAMAVICLPLLAQQPQMPNQKKTLLTKEQREQVKTLRLEMDKEMITLDNELGIRKAELKALQQTENVNMKKVNDKIDEIGSLNTKKMKLKAAFGNDVRSMLSAEQKIEFDKMQGHKGRPAMHREGMQGPRYGMQGPRYGMQGPRYGMQGQGTKGRKPEIAKQNKAEKTAANK